MIFLVRVNALSSGGRFISPVPKAINEQTTTIIAFRAKFKKRSGVHKIVTFLCAITTYFNL